MVYSMINVLYWWVNIFHVLLHWENYISISFHIEWYMIVVTVFLSTLNQMELHFCSKSKGKTVTTIISHSMWKEMEMQFSQCSTVRCTGVRENGVSRHHGGPIEGPPGTFVHHSTMLSRGLRRALICSPIIPRDTSFRVEFL